MVGQLASDQRVGVLALLLAPALGWVGFNILGPGLNQLDDLNAANAKAAGTKRAIVGGLGLSSAPRAHLPPAAPRRARRPAGPPRMPGGRPRLPPPGELPPPGRDAGRLLARGRVAPCGEI